MQTEKASKTRRCHDGDVRSCQIAIINLVAVKVIENNLVAVNEVIENNLVAVNEVIENNHA